MTFICNNPTPKHRKPTDHFENGKVNSKEQQENKALQRMMQAGSRVYTRSNTTPMTTGQAVTPPLALGTIDNRTITSEAQWLAGGRLLPTWVASDDEIDSMNASSSHGGSEREIIVPADVKSSGSGYPDMTGAEVPEEQAKLELKSKMDPLSIIRDPETLKAFGKEATDAASRHPWRRNYSPSSINKITYRGDGRLPDELFYSGFIRHEVPPEVFRIGKGFGVAGAVSTTTNEKIALQYATNQVPGGYVYALKLRNGGAPIDSYSIKGEFLSELAVLNVPPQDIMFAIGPFDTVRTTLTEIEGIDSIEIRLNPYSDATYEQAKEAYDALRNKLSTALKHDETICFYDRWESRKDLLFLEKDANVYIKEKLKAIGIIVEEEEEPQASAS